MSSINHLMREAMQLMHAGDLQAATRVIQRGLGRDGANVAPDMAGANSSWIDAEYRVVGDNAEAPPREEPTRPDESVRDTPDDGSFTAHRFRCEAGTMHYKLFVPPRLAAGAPLIVMLHGCTQSPDDFARGTRMNVLAREHGYAVAYPAQPRSRNASNCWNWFREGDQQRGSGEPGVIAALTRHLVQEHALDAQRVYAAGLSAGGAMAAVLGGTYPDLYAAIGVHSGLPFGAARDLPSALAAMKQGRGAGSVIAHLVPAIVFHGDRDMTVDRCNGDAVIQQFIGNKAAAHDAMRPAADATVERASPPNGRSYTRSLFRDANGIVIAEHWEVHGGGHAWFGGDPSGTFTDPRGPDASEHMLRFFRGRTRRTMD
jgi:poly(hydroxyalkanoate) depolymerase family esterase